MCWILKKLSTLQQSELILCCVYNNTVNTCYGKVMSRSWLSNVKNINFWKAAWFKTSKQHIRAQKVAAQMLHFSLLPSNVLFVNTLRYLLFELLHLKQYPVLQLTKSVFSSCSAYRWILMQPERGTEKTHHVK